MKSRSPASTRPVVVRAYQRLRDGKRELVRRHTRRPHTQMVLPFEKDSVARGDDAKKD